jgi:hypothetical protein
MNAQVARGLPDGNRLIQFNFVMVDFEFHGLLRAGVWRPAAMCGVGKPKAEIRIPKEGRNPNSGSSWRGLNQKAST